MKTYYLLLTTQPTEPKVSPTRNLKSIVAGQLNKFLAKELDENETMKGVASDGAGRSFDSTV